MEPSNMTYAVWVKANTGWFANASAVFMKGGGAGARVIRASATATNSVLQFLGNTGGNGNVADSKNINIADGNWHHIAFTWDGATVTYYIDGGQVGSKSTNTTSFVYSNSFANLLYIGSLGTANYFNGRFYDFRIYNTALPAWQLASLTNPPATVLFSDNFNPAVSTNLFDATGRATGTLASNTVYYSWSNKTNNVAVNGTLTWNADGTANANNELGTAYATRNLLFGTSPNAGWFDWYPYVGGKVWEVQYDTLTGNSQVLTFGLSHITRNGVWSAWSDTNYDFSFGNYGTACRFDGPSGAQTNYTSIANIFPTRTNSYNIRLHFDEPKGLVTMYVNGTNIATTNLYNIGLANHRYISWGEPGKYGGNIDNLTISIPAAPSINVQPFAVIPAAANLIANGDFTQVANAVLGAAATAPTTFNINGSRGDFSSVWGSTADVLNWTPYYSDPNGLTTNCVPFTDDPSYVLNGTYYLDTLIETNAHAITLNSADYYLNGLVQTNILNGVTPKSGAQYQLVIKAGTTANTEQYYATFAAGLTVGAGVNATNPATAVPNSAFSMWAHDLPTAGTTNITSVINGADLLAAQGSGPINVIFNQLNSNGIAGYPTSPNPNDISQVSQVKVYGVSLTVIVPADDLNHDGVVDQADVNLAQSYLDGSIDGGDAATNRENELINTYGYSTNQALSYLNLGPFDINADGYFDAADVAALQAIVGPVGPTLSSVSPNPVTGSSYPVTLTLTGSGFAGATAVLLTNLTASTGASYSPTVNGDTSISVSFVPGTAAGSWNATVVNSSPSAQVGFTVNAASAVSFNNNALTSAGAGKLVLAGTGGAAGNRYVVLSATNLTPPVVWTPIATNAFDGSGNFSYTNTVNQATPNLFLRIQQ
jgi:hypothetical protein